MQLPNDLSADDLGDSSYARALRSHVTCSRFSPDLELQYLAEHLRRAHLRVRVWFSLNLVLALMTTVLSLRQQSGSALLETLDASLLLCAVVMIWLVWSKLYERCYLSAAVVFVPLTGILNCVSIAQAIATGNEGAITALAVGVIASFFFCGLLFRSALFAALVIPIGFVVSSFFFGAPPLVILRGGLVLAVICGVGAIIYRDIEATYRKSFLEAGLIGEL